MKVYDLTTPCLIADGPATKVNIQTMSNTLPGTRLRPHVKAHKSTEIAMIQSDLGHVNFTCATPREAAGLISRGLGEDILVANEVVNSKLLTRLAHFARDSHGRVTIAVDSQETVEKAALAGIRDVLVDVNVGLPRCGCEPALAGSIADLARRRNLNVRGVMGYEGHCVGLEDACERAEQTHRAMDILKEAHEQVGGDIISAGGTGTYEINRWANEIQAGSYVFMDSAYSKLELPFENSLAVLSTIISTNPQGWMVCDAGLKSLGMDHGNPTIQGADVWFCSDEHITFSLTQVPQEQTGLKISSAVRFPVNSTSKVGDMISVIPAHIDPTIAYHDKIYVLDGEDVVDQWAVDLSGWDI